MNKYFSLPIILICFSLIITGVLINDHLKKGESIMLLYKITYQVQVNKEDNVSLHKEWVGSKSDAAKYRAWARQRHGYIPNSVQTEFINIPTDKKGLIKLLNSGIDL